MLHDHLAALGRTVVATRYQCNELFDLDDKPFKVIRSREAGGDTIISPGCEAALSLLDAVHNFPEMLICWGKEFWCRPRSLYDELRQHEIEHESGLARFTGFLNPAEIVAPSEWRCDSSGLRE